MLYYIFLNEFKIAYIIRYLHYLVPKRRHVFNIAVKLIVHMVTARDSTRRKNSET